MKNTFLMSFAVAFLGLAPFSVAQVEVKLDVSEVPALADWGKMGQKVLKDWHPRLTNMLSSPGFTPPQSLSLRIKKSDKGVGATSGTKISISSSWIEKHPQDVGLLVHELVHVIQRYPNARPVWVTEGIADYIRWGIFEGQPLEKFPIPKEADGYKKGYQPTAGFFLWLETHKAPGIVRRLNTSMRASKYSEKIFEDAAGKPLAELWAEYQKTKKK